MKKLKMLSISAVAVMLSLCLSITFSSCSSDDDDDAPAIETHEPGKIPGLGNTEGELTGTPFALPSELELEGEIVGYADITKSLVEKQDITAEAIEARLSSLLKDTRNTLQIDTIMGSGYFVQVIASLKNKSDRDFQYTFPAGMVVKSNSGRYQHGVLLKKISFTFPANKSTKVALLMYCGNAAKSSSSSSEKYSWGVVSNSSLIYDLCERLKNKKINYEEFKSEGYHYSIQVSDLQSILWDLTDRGYALTERQIEYINNLPNSN